MPLIKMSVKKIISKALDPISIVIPIHDLWQMIQIPGDDMPEELSPAVLRKELIKILDRTARKRPTHDIISIRNEIRNNSL